MSQAEHTARAVTQRDTAVLHLAGIALAAPFALLAGISVWALPETKGVRLARSQPQERLADGDRERVRAGY